MNRQKEIALMIMAPICCLIAIINVIFGVESVAILFISVESISLVLLCYLFFSDNDIKAEDEVNDSEIILNMEQDLTEKKQNIFALEKELEEKTREISQLEKLKEETDASLKARIVELENKEVLKNSEAFLPPVSDNESDEDTIDIVETARKTALELSDAAKEARIDVVVSSASESLLVRGSASRMKIMFKNIIDNSIKYMQRAGKLIITVSSIGDDIFIVLKDNGNGLNEDETKHIFELNFQGSNRISGNGLGLTQAKAIVEYYGGTIYAKSNRDKGMGIYIQLPTT